MEKIKAILHGTSTKTEEEKKAENTASHFTTQPTTGEGSHLSNATQTSNTSNVNPASSGVDNTNVPHRTGESQLDTNTTGTSGLGGVGNNSNNTGIQNNTTSGLGGVTSIPSGNELETHGRDNAGTSGTSNHHYGRDAALGGGAVGAAGLAEHEHRNHEHRGIDSNQTGTAGNNFNRDAGLGSNQTGTAGNNFNRDTGLGSNQTGYGSNTTGTTGSSGHHLGHDAVAAGAVGEGIHHHNNHNEHNQGGHFGGIGGPHNTATANRLDPNLDNSNVRTEGAHNHHGHGAQAGRVEGGGAEEADGFHGAKGTSAGAGVVGKEAFEAGHGHNTTAGPHSSNLANKEDPRVDSDLSKQQGHHYGRDAALAGGVGGAAYEADKHGGNHGTNTGNTTAGPHSSNLENKADPRVDSDLSKQQGHHYGRDAAVAGGVGGAGYEANKHFGQHGTTGNTTAGPHSSNFENKSDPRVDSDLSKQQKHHYGRDAAVAGGVGGAAYEADKHHRHDKTTAGPRSSNLENKADPRVDSDRSRDQHHHGRDAALVGGAGTAAYEADKHHHNNKTTAGPHSSNIENKADPRVDSDRSKEGHHYGRDAAVAGGVGGAAYEADKHHHNNKTTAGPHSSNIENKADPRVDSDRSKEGHHYGRDAALAGGAGTAAYEAEKHHNNHGTEHKPVGKDIGDKLHGVERNRGVNGPTGFPHESGHSTGPTGAVGTGVPGAPRGNVQQTSNDNNAYGQDNSHPVHNSARGPDHIFTAPVMDDPNANSDLRNGKIDQHEHRHEHGVGHAGHEHGKEHHHHAVGDERTSHNHQNRERGLENEINAAPLGNTSSTPGSHLEGNTGVGNTNTTSRAL